MTSNSEPNNMGKTDLSLVEPRIGDAILIIRGRQVMLDADLAALYEVETKVLNQAVKRHGDRFPDDFMFQLSKKKNEGDEDVTRRRSALSLFGVV